MTAQSQDLLKEFGRLMQTFHNQRFSQLSKHSHRFWTQQPQRGQIRVLLLLDQNEKLTNSQIVDKLDIRPSSVSVMVRKLIEEGYVERKDSAEDKRVSYLSLTQKGRDSLKQSRQFRDDFADSLFDGLTDSEKETLQHLLAKLTDSWHEKWDENESQPEFLRHLPDHFFERREQTERFRSREFDAKQDFGKKWGHPNDFDGFHSRH
ncbi:MarR family winged helix-turn-helix transcriptional regulator [Pediococcus siamensis]|uniref:MarR family winged helix-turn-helix transcriptional regulator n=1 Tax=Pediococcus siamensis TaxID=381829 RepID=UPI00399FBA04